eukprot:3975165-Amphidinium_carterae.1
MQPECKVLLSNGVVVQQPSLYSAGGGRLQNNRSTHSALQHLMTNRGYRMHLLETTAGNTGSASWPLLNGGVPRMDSCEEGRAGQVDAIVERRLHHGKTPSFSVQVVWK